MEKIPSTSNRQDRLNKWRNLDYNLFKQLPSDMQSYVIAALEEDARNQLKIERIAEFNTRRSHRLPKHLDHLNLSIIILVGALTFSVAPQLLAKQSGRGAIAISTGLIGGAVASFYAHQNAVKALTGMKLKASTKQARQAIISKLNQD